MDMIYINEAEALKRLGGNKTLYKKLLGNFLGSIKKYDVSKEISQGNIKTAQTVAHTVKGMAANLSLIAIYEEANKLDIMLKNNNIDANILQAYEKIITETLNEINKYLNA